MVHSARWQNFLITNLFTCYQEVLARVESKTQHSALPSDLFFVKAEDMNYVLDIFYLWEIQVRTWRK